MLVVVALLGTCACAGSTEERFDDCRIEDGAIVLTFSHGANQRVSPTVDSRDGGLVVSLRTESGAGPTPAIGLVSEARFSTFGGVGTVVYPDGLELACSVAGAAARP